MLLRILLVSLALSVPSWAHFSVVSPYWRGNSYPTQWERPCGGVNQSISDTNRTEWPLDGGSVVFRGSHPWAYTFVNLGIGGDNTTNFNITLVDGFNQTGNGTFCFPRITLPVDLQVSDGTNASIQVVQVNEQGSALYNCADITFSTDARILGADECSNSTGVGGYFFEAQAATSSSGSGSGSSTQSGAAASATGAGTRVTVVVGLTMLAVPASLAVLMM